MTGECLLETATSPDPEPEVRQLNVRVDSELHQRLRLLAVTLDRPIQDLVAEAVERLLREQSGRAAG